MRWLAYGGTKLEVRYQTGAWDIRHDALWPEAGLPEDGALAFGAGEWEGEIVLVVRQLQKDHVGRDKAYTLLLLPSQDVWETVAWNAAALAWQLFEAPGSAGSWLLKEPELERGHPGRALATVRAAARAWHGDADAGHGEVLGRLLAASWMEERLVEVPLAECFGGRLPRAAQLAAAFDWLPPCFRAGWMAGGNAPLAEALGIPLLLHDGKGRDDRPELAEKGRKLLDSWREVAEASPAIHGRQSLPAQLWQKAGLGDAASGIAAASWLALLSQSNAQEALATALKASPRRLHGLPSDALQEVRASMVGILLKSASPGQIMDQHANMILEVACSGALTSDVRVPRGLFSSEQVAAYLKAHDLSPVDLPAGLLDVDLMLRLWSHSVLEAGSLERALKELSALISKNQDGGQPGFLLSLFQDALERWSEHGPLRHWLPVIEKAPALHEALRPALAEQAVRRLVNDLPGSARDYLLLADDHAAARLLKVPAAKRKNAFASALRRALEIAETKDAPPDPRVAAAVNQWLSGLQVSALREKMDIQAKRRAARFSRWEFFLLLERVLLGDGMASHPAAPSAEEQTFLAGEAQQLAHVRTLGCPPPDLTVLETLTGRAVLAKVVGIVVLTKPDLAGPAGDQWITNLWSKELDECAVQEQTRRVLNETREDLLLNYWFLCDPILMINSLEKLVFYKSSAEGADEAVAHALTVAVARIARSSPSSSLAAGCRSLLHRLSDGSGRERSAFISRLWQFDVEAFWSWLFLASERVQASLVADWASMYPQELKKLLQLENELRRKHPLETVFYAPLWRFLRMEEEGLKALGRLDKNFRKPPPQWAASRPAYRAVLDESLLQQVDAGETSAPERKESFFRRLWRWLWSIPESE